jgi:hypothetical protein
MTFSWAANAFALRLVRNDFLLGRDRLRLIRDNFLLGRDRLGLVRNDFLLSCGRLRFDSQRFRLVRNDFGRCQNLHGVGEPVFFAAHSLGKRSQLGNVAGDFHKADDVASGVVHHIDHHAGPQKRSIFAYAPAFALKCSGGLRNLERARWLARAGVVVRKKDAEMGPDDVPRAIAFDELCARIPAFHRAVEIEHVNRVVDDAIDEHLRDASV